MLSPATLALLHRLVAILLVLIDALAAPVDGAPRPLVARLATGALSAYLKRLTAQLAEVADQRDPAPTPPPTPARRLHSRHTPPRPPTMRLPSAPAPAPNFLQLEIDRQASTLQHAQFVTIP